MKTALTIPVLLLTAAALTTAVAGVEGEVYGAPLTGTETVPIADLLDNPDVWVGKNVRIEGLVTNVCERRGCWMSLASTDEDFKEIRVKVDDGVIVFPMTAKGHHAIAEGVFMKVEMTMEQTLTYMEHHAQEHGEEFDASKVTEPMVFYQIKGSGAVIR